MYVLFTIIFVVVLVAAAFVTYKTAEAHELHKMRAAFEDRKIDIQKLIADHKDNDPDFNYDYYRGELEEIDELESLIDEELEILKNFNFDSD